MPERHDLVPGDMVVSFSDWGDRCLVIASPEPRKVHVMRCHSGGKISFHLNLDPRILLDNPELVKVPHAQ